MNFLTETVPPSNVLYCPTMEKGRKVMRSDKHSKEWERPNDLITCVPATVAPKLVWLRTHYVLTAEDRKADHVIAVTGSGVLGDWLSEKCHISMEYPPKSCFWYNLLPQCEDFKLIVLDRTRGTVVRWEEQENRCLPGSLPWSGTHIPVLDTPWDGASGPGASINPMLEEDMLKTLHKKIPYGDLAVVRTKKHRSSSKRKPKPKPKPVTLGLQPSTGSSWHVKCPLQVQCPVRITDAFMSEGKSNPNTGEKLSASRMMDVTYSNAIPDSNLGVHVTRSDPVVLDGKKLGLSAACRIDVGNGINDRPTLCVRSLPITLDKNNNVMDLVVPDREPDKSTQHRLLLKVKVAVKSGLKNFLFAPWWWP